MLIVNKASIAHLVEHLASDLMVPGSIPDWETLPFPQVVAQPMKAQE